MGSMGGIKMNYMKKYEEWLEGKYFDEKTKEELQSIKGNRKEIEERFYKDLEFGTGGLRGILGAGTNRMNIYTVRKATQGLANYILKHSEEGAKKGIAIAYDSRRMSPEFADEVTRVMAANGIKGYVFKSLRPTPVLSFAVRELGCIAGIVITASHNPAEYNGYKVYWEDGAQVAYPRDVNIIDEVTKVESYDQVKIISKEEALNKGLYNIIDEQVDNRYIDELKKLVISQDVINKEKDMVIVYTPLHGTGNIPVRRILKEVGFENVYVVEEQEKPNGNFPTVSYPNPEDIKAFQLALKLGKEKNADIILATDPDADRIGILAKTNEGNYYQLTGNMIGVLLLDYIVSRKEEKGTLPKNGAIIETIVSTKMAKAIGEYYNMEVMEVLTGFKYIGELMKQFDETKSNEYLFGFEESYGCLIGTHARDKDAVVASMGICEVVAYYKAKGMTLYDALLALYEKYGYYKETLKSITLKGIEGIEKIKHILTTLRENPPKEVNGIKVLEARDYKKEEIKNLVTNEVLKTNLPNSNVLYYVLEDESWFCVRPSGTEPKVKFYFGVKGTSIKDVDARIEQLELSVMANIKNMIE
jgi:phosphoglucomutase